MTELLKSLSDLKSVDRTEDSAGRTCLSTDSELNALKSSCCLLGILLDLSDLVSALLLVFCKTFQCCCGSDDSLPLRNQVIAAITIFHFDNIVLITEFGYVFFKYDFHLCNFCRV